MARPNVLAPATPDAVDPERVAPAPQKVAANTHLVDVSTPLPGTFYRAPQPGAPPFVEPGSAVDPTTVVCIIETMKLMNSVRAGMRGRIAEICLADAQFAGPGTVLMRIEPKPE